MDAAINIDNYITSDPFLSLKPEQTVHEPPAPISDHSLQSPAEFPGPWTRCAVCTAKVRRTVQGTCLIVTRDIAMKTQQSDQSDKGSPT